MEINKQFSSSNELSQMGDIGELIKKFQTKLCKPEDMLIIRGNESFYIFFLSKGTIEIYLNDPRYGRIEGEYFELNPGSIFGEIGVLLQTKRSAYARA
jgi:CRP-like cAMP-binding protein